MAAIRTQRGSSVVGILHEGTLVVIPKHTSCFVMGDKVAVMGNTEQLDALNVLLR